MSETPLERLPDRQRDDVLRFFAQAPAALPLFEALLAPVLALDAWGPVTLKVQKSQIGFYNRHLFGCASLARVRPKRALPDPWLTVTFGLDHRVDSPRIAVASEPYPNRWTHHLVIGRPQEVDDELLAWLREAAALAAAKR